MPIDEEQDSTTSGMVPMLSPDGSAGQIPAEKVKDATAAGFKQAVVMTDLDGNTGFIPQERAHEAVKAGFTPGQAVDSSAAGLQPKSAWGVAKDLFSSAPSVAAPHAATPAPAPLSGNSGQPQIADIKLDPNAPPPTADQAAQLAQRMNQPFSLTPAAPPAPVATPATIAAQAAGGLALQAMVPTKDKMEAKKQALIQQVQAAMPSPLEGALHDPRLNVGDVYAPEDVAPQPGPPEYGYGSISADKGPQFDVAKMAKNPLGILGQAGDYLDEKLKRESPGYRDFSTRADTPLSIGTDGSKHGFKTAASNTAKWLDPYAGDHRSVLDPHHVDDSPIWRSGIDAVEGAAAGVGGLIDSLTSPKNIALLIAMRKLPPTAAAGVDTYFASSMMQNAPDIAAQGIRKIRNDDPSGWEDLMTGLGQAGMAASSFKGAKGHLDAPYHQAMTNLRDAMADHIWEKGGIEDSSGTWVKASGKAEAEQIANKFVEDNVDNPQLNGSAKRVRKATDAITKETERVRASKDAPFAEEYQEPKQLTDGTQAIVHPDEVGEPEEAAKETASAAEPAIVHPDEIGEEPKVEESAIVHPEEIGRPEERKPTAEQIAEAPPGLNPKLIKDVRTQSDIDAAKEAAGIAPKSRSIEDIQKDYDAAAEAGDRAKMREASKELIRAQNAPKEEAVAEPQEEEDEELVLGGPKDIETKRNVSVQEPSGEGSDEPYPERNAPQRASLDPLGGNVLGKTADGWTIGGYRGASGKWIIRAHDTDDYQHGPQVHKEFPPTAKKEAQEFARSMDGKPLTAWPDDAVFSRRAEEEQPEGTATYSSHDDGRGEFLDKDGNVLAEAKNPVHYYNKDGKITAIKEGGVTRAFSGTQDKPFGRPISPYNKDKGGAVEKPAVSESAQQGTAPEVGGSARPATPPKKQAPKIELDDELRKAFGDLKKGFGGDSESLSFSTNAKGPSFAARQALVKIGSKVYQHGITGKEEWKQAVDSLLREHVGDDIADAVTDYLDETHEDVEEYHNEQSGNQPAKPAEAAAEAGADRGRVSQPESENRDSVQDKPAPGVEEGQARGHEKDQAAGAGSVREADSNVGQGNAVPSEHGSSAGGPELSEGERQPDAVSKILNDPTTTHDEKAEALSVHLENLKLPGVYNASAYTREEWKYLTGKAEEEPHKPSDFYKAALDEAEKIVSKMRDLADDRRTHLEAVRLRISTENAEHFFRHVPEEIGVGGEIGKTETNIAALKLLKQLAEENRPATLAEKKVLAKYVGWGGLSGNFNYSNALYKRFNKEISKHISSDQYNELARSTQYAHFTSPTVVQFMWDAMQHMGFKGGRVLEPGMGVGYFLGLAPEEVINHPDTHFNGVERDSITAAIATALWGDNPKASIAATEFQALKAPNGYFDLAIGNPPFSDMVVKSDPEYKTARLSLHNYFILKALDKVRPGGIGMFVTSNSTMDNASNLKGREMFAARADLLGALRLPEDAHKKNAGTTVATDILIFRKRAAGEAAGGETFKNAVPHKVRSGGEIQLNEYFDRHPENVIGTLTDEGGRFAGAVGVEYDGDLKAALAVALERVAPKGALQQGAGVEGEVSLAGTFPKDGTYHVDENGKITQWHGGQRAQIDPAKQNFETMERIKKLVALREHFDSLVQMMLRTSTENDHLLEEPRKLLNELYDNYVWADKAKGKLKHGFLHSFDTKQAFEDDPSYYRMVGALERHDKGYKGGTKYAKMPVFERRTIWPFTEPQMSSTDPRSWVAASHIIKGDLNTEFIANKLGMDPKEVAKQLRDADLAYQNPLTGAWEDKSAYLSGNVRQKLAHAIEASRNLPEFGRNVKALMDVQPKDIPLEKVEATPGVSWVPLDAYHDWAHAMFKNKRIRLEVGEDDRRTWKANPDWKKGPLYEVENKFAVRDDDGSILKNGMQLLLDTLNQKQSKVYRTDPDGKSYIDKKFTEASRLMQQQIRDHFQDWMRTNEDWNEGLTRAYNEANNSVVNREWDGSHLGDPIPLMDRNGTPKLDSEGKQVVGYRLPGMSPDISMYPHQVNGIWRGLADGRALYGHEVGMGKTFIMASVAQLSRRMGLARKPAITTLNEVNDQLVHHISSLYPSAHVAALTTDMLDKASRKKTLGMIQSSDPDIIVLPHSVVDMLAVPPEWEKATVEAALEEARETMKDMDDRKTVKEMEKRIEKLEERLTSLAAGRSEDSLYFDELGIDQLHVDEAHKYKNLPIFSKMGDIEHLPSSGAESERALHMKMIGDYLHSQRNRRGLYFYTGTPITNTMAELYNMNKFIAPDTLTDAGIETFDQWVANFGQVQTTWGIAPDGMKYRAKPKMVKFQNVPELSTATAQYMDIARRSMYPHVVDAPAADRGQVEVEMSATQTAMMKEIARRFANMPKDRRIDNALKASTDASKISLDPRLVNHEIFGSPERIKILEVGLENAKGEGNKAQVAELRQALKEEKAKGEEAKQTKTYQVAKLLADRFHANAEEKLTQAIYSEFFQNKEMRPVMVKDKKTGESKTKMKMTGKVHFNVFHEIRRLLTQEFGVPADQIAIIHDYSGKSEKQKARRQELFDKFNRGDVRIFMGTSQKGGTGVNIQERLKDLYHIDQPWTPAMLEQREGRIQRQGNLNRVVGIHTLVATPKPDLKVTTRAPMMSERTADVAPAGPLKLGGMPNDLYKRQPAEKLGRKGKPFESLVERFPRSFDAYKWQKLVNKRTFFNQFMDGQMKDRVIEDLAGEVLIDDKTAQAIAMGDEAALDRVRIEQELGSLRQQYALFNDNKRKLKSDLRFEQERQRRLQLNKDGLQEFVDTYRKVKDGGFKAVIDGKEFTERSEALAYLNSKYQAGTPLNGGHFNFYGVDVPIRYNGSEVWNSTTNKMVKGQWEYQFGNGWHEAPTTGSGLLQGWENRARHAEVELKSATASIDDAKRAQDDIRSRMKGEFAHKDKIGALEKELREVLDELGINNLKPYIGETEVEDEDDDDNESDEGGDSLGFRVGDSDSEEDDEHESVDYSRGGSKLPQGNGSYVGPPVSRVKMMAMLMKLAGASHLGMGKMAELRKMALGLYMPMGEHIRLRHYGDIPTLAHEVFHSLNKVMFGKRGGSKINSVMPSVKAFDQFKKELASIATPAPAGLPGGKQLEGFAEYGRMLLTNPTEAAARVPNFHNWFMGELQKPENKAHRELIGGLQNLISNFTNQTDEAYVASHISTDANDSKAMANTSPVQAWHKFYSAMVDALDPLSRATNEMMEANYKGEPLAAKDNPYVRARLLKGVVSKVQAFLEHGTFNADDPLTVTGKPLKEIIGQLDEGQTGRLDRYLVAKSSIEDADKRGMDTAFDDLSKVRNFVESVEANNPEIVKAAEEYRKWMGSLLKYAKDSGRFSAEQVAAMQDLNEFYATKRRLFFDDERNVLSQMKGAGKIGNNAGPIKPKHGSTRDVISPLQSAIMMAYHIINASDRNKVALSLYNLRGVSEGSGKWAREVDVPPHGTNFRLEEIKKALKEAGFTKDQLDNADLDTIASVFRPAPTPKGQNIIGVYDNGKLRHMELAPELYNALQQLDHDEANMFVKVLSHPASAVRLGSTMYSPRFGLRHLIRQGLMAMAQTVNGQTPFDQIAGLYHVVKHDDLYWKAKMSGAFQSADISMDRKHLQKTIEDFMQSKWKFTLMHPLEVMKILNEASDESGRVAEFVKALAAGKDGFQSAFDARDSGVDAGRMGRWMKSWNRMTAFANIGIQHTDSFFRAHRRNLKRSLVMGAACAAISAIVQMMNQGNEKYDELEPWRKFMFWNIPTDGTPLEGILPFIQIPKPFLWGYVYGSGTDAVFDYMKKHDPEVMSDYFYELARELAVNPMPTGATVAYEVGANKSMLTGKPLVYPYEQGIKPHQQQYPYTSEMSKGMAKGIYQLGKAVVPESQWDSWQSTFDFSPIKIDHLLFGVGGSALRDASKVVDIASGNASVHSASDLPVIGAWTSRWPNPQAQSITKLYERLQFLEEKAKTQKDVAHRGETPDEPMSFAERQELSRLRGADQEIRKVHTLTRNIDGDKDMDPKEKRTRENFLMLRALRIAQNATRNKGE